MTGIRAAIVGVGRIGSRFDEEPGRRSVWSHAGAYLSHPGRFQLVAAVEVDRANCAAFRQRCPEAEIFENVESMVRTARPGIVSICTPTTRHFVDTQAVLAGESVRAVWCEKPLAGSLSDASHLVEAARARGVALVTSYVRRWLPLWQRVRAIVASGKIGAPVGIRVAMPNRLLTIQSHAVDLALYFGGAVSGYSATPIPALAEDGEPAAVIVVNFVSGAYGIVHPTGMRDRLLIEVEILGNEGRLRAAEHDGRIAIELFGASANYAGYRELGPLHTEVAATLADFSPFTAIAGDLAAAWAGNSLDALDNGADALRVQGILADAESAICVPVAKASADFQRKVS